MLATANNVLVTACPNQRILLHNVFSRRHDWYSLVPPSNKEKVYCVVHIERAYRIILEFLNALTHLFFELRRECHYHISNWLRRDASSLRSSLERYLFLSKFFLKGSKLYVLPRIRHHLMLTNPYYCGKDYPPAPILGQFAACAHQRNYVERDYYKHRQKSEMWGSFSRYVMLWQTVHCIAPIQ